MEVVTDAPDGEPDVLKGVHGLGDIKVEVIILGDIKVEVVLCGAGAAIGCEEGHSHLVEGERLLGSESVDLVGGVRCTQRPMQISSPRAPYLEFLVLISILLAKLRDLRHPRGETPRSYHPSS